MACACKVTQELTYLQRKYGHNMPKSKSSNIKEMASGIVKQIGIMILALPFLPLMIIGIMFNMLFKRNKAVEIDKVFKIRKANG